MHVFCICAYMYVSTYHACMYISISLVVARNKIRQRELDASRQKNEVRAKSFRSKHFPSSRLKSKFAPLLLLHPITALAFPMNLSLFYSVFSMLHGL